MRGAFLRCASGLILATVILLGLLAPGPVAVPAAPARAPDRFILISGGGDPISNNYSQFLQARLLADNLIHWYGPARIDVFFGAGNQPQTSNAFPDVHRVETQQGRSVHSFVVGRISNATAATRQRILERLESEDIRKHQGTLFLIVGDHGLGQQRYRDNCIVLWSHDSDGRSIGRDGQCLRVSDLAKLIPKLSARRTVFFMSQCYSGGFHQLAVDDQGSHPTTKRRVCGFSSTTARRMASGCTPDVSDERYQGYERSLAEALTGIDVVSGRRLAQTVPASALGVHRLAALRDATIDIPLSTSEYFLLRWAKSIESKAFVARNARVKANSARTLLKQAATGSLTRGVARNRREPRLRDFTRYLIETETMLARHLSKPGSLNPGTGRIELALRDLTADQNRNFEARKNVRKQHANLRRSQLLPVWRELFTDDAPARDFEIDEFEPTLLRRDWAQSHKSNWAARLERFFLVNLFRTTRRNPERAHQMATYFADRESRMLGYMERSGDLAGVAMQLRKLASQLRNLEQEAWDLERQRGLLLRAQQMRRILGARLALVKMRDKKALAELAELEACEQTVLPHSPRRQTR